MIEQASRQFSDSKDTLKVVKKFYGTDCMVIHMVTWYKYNDPYKSENSFQKLNKIDCETASILLLRLYFSTKGTYKTDEPMRVLPMFQLQKQPLAHPF